MEQEYRTSARRELTYPDCPSCKNKQNDGSCKFSSVCQVGVDDFGRFGIPDYWIPEGCLMCSTKYFKGDWACGGAHDFRIHDKVLYYFDTQMGWEGMGIKYCPMCGREL